MLLTFLNEVTASNVSVAARWPTGYTGDQLVVVVERTGGAMNHNVPWLDNPTIDVKIGGPKKSVANDLMQIVRSWLLVAWGYPHREGVITNVHELIGPQWVADPDYPPAGHYVITADVSCHPIT